MNLTPLLSDDRNPDIIGATKTKITYDSKGLVIRGADLSSDIPNPANKIITHRFVTDVEKNLWTSKSDFSGNYDDLTNKPVIPAKTSDLVNDSDFAMLDIPVKVSDLENDAEFITLANIPTDLSSFNDDVGFALEEDIPTIPTKISDLENDQGFITKDYVDNVHFNLGAFIPEVGISYWLSEADIINEVFFW